MEIAIGQVWRDTYGDNRKSRDGKNRLPPNKRTVRVTGVGLDGRWSILTLTDAAGNPPKGKGRETRVKPETLTSGYELLSASA